ncbi:MAG: hypothetical protein LR011_12810 [Verrucomicrobia bacterium]|nr:hypothetical protein [Verrucomicrobiota bacterium]
MNSHISFGLHAQKTTESGLSGHRISRLFALALGFFRLLVLNASAQSPYEIVELKLPGDPDAPIIVTHLNNAGQIAGFVNRPGGESFIARWEPGKTSLTDVRIFRPGDFDDLPAGIIQTSVHILALYHSGDGLIRMTGILPLNPHQRHPLTQRRYSGKGFTRVMHYSAGTFRTVKEFETWGGAYPGWVTAFSESGDGKFVFSEYGGDDLFTRYPPDETGLSWNPHVPSYPEVWKMSDLSGQETLLPTGRDLLSQPGDYRYQTLFSHMDAAGNLYAQGIFRAHPLTSFGRPVVRSGWEVWVGGQPQSLSDFAGSAAGVMGISQVNRDGEITGLFGQNPRKVALYLPRPNYGRVAGAHTITTMGAAMSVSRINRQGALVWSQGSTTPGVYSLEGMLWSAGTNRSLNSPCSPRVSSAFVDRSQCERARIGTSQ